MKNIARLENNTCQECEYCFPKKFSKESHMESIHEEQDPTIEMVFFAHHQECLEDDLEVPIEVH